jgi:putative spermidine/putrescine transport system substrate-binding protein
MTSNNSINTGAASKLPAVTGTPVFLTEGQSTTAAQYLATNWAKAVS